MDIVERICELRDTVHRWRAGGQSVAFVPTMGNLHAGHFSLVSQARGLADRVVVSIFVNPTQFCAGEDYATYPRTVEQDRLGLQDAGADLLFLPSVGEMYPDDGGGTTYVEVAGLSDELCGRFRPGHFRGVTTVVCKLFQIVQPDVALFGDKDYQQLTLIRRMTADLNLPVRIVGAPTVREASGLAMSSRNGYLSPDEKQRAADVYRCLLAAKGALEAGRRDFDGIEDAQMAALSRAGFRPDYVAIRRADDLGMPAVGDRALVVLVAAWLGKARLIDNLRVDL